MAGCRAAANRRYLLGQLLQQQRHQVRQRGLDEVVVHAVGLGRGILQHNEAESRQEQGGSMQGARSSDGGSSSSNETAASRCTPRHTDPIAVQLLLCHGAPKLQRLQHNLLLVALHSGDASRQDG